MAAISRDMMIERLESFRGEPLTQDEKDELILWDKGRSLNQIVSLNGYEVILEMLQSYAEKAIQELLNADPASKEDVLANHSIAFVSHKIFRNFVTDVNNAVEASKKTPEFLKKSLRNPAEGNL